MCHPDVLRSRDSWLNWDLGSPKTVRFNSDFLFHPTVLTFPSVHPSVQAMHQAGINRKLTSSLFQRQQSLEGLQNYCSGRCLACYRVSQATDDQPGSAILRHFLVSCGLDMVRPWQQPTWWSQPTLETSGVGIVKHFRAERKPNCLPKITNIFDVAWKPCLWASGILRFFSSCWWTEGTFCKIDPRLIQSQEPWASIWLTSALSFLLSACFSEHTVRHQPLGLFHARLITESTLNHMITESKNTASCQHVSLRLCTITIYMKLAWDRERLALTNSVRPQEWLLLKQQHGQLFAVAAPHKVWSGMNHIDSPSFSGGWAGIVQIRLNRLADMASCPCFANGHPRGWLYTWMGSKW